MMNTKEAILLHAREMFNTLGYTEVGVRDIARGLSISPGNLSYHFKKKEDLLEELLKEFSLQNDLIYRSYAEQPPSLAGFIEMMDRIFQNQYRYRGVFIGNSFVQTEIRKRKALDYPAVAKKRLENFESIFIALHKEGFLKLNEEDIKFLVRFMSLFGRFWIAEACILNKSPDREVVIPEYLEMLRQQLLHFSTSKGKAILFG